MHFGFGYESEKKRLTYSPFFLSKFYEKYIDGIMMSLNSKRKKKYLKVLESFSNFDASVENFEISNSV